MALSQSSIFPDVSICHPLLTAPSRGPPSIPECKRALTTLTAQYLAGQDRAVRYTSNPDSDDKWGLPLHEAFYDGDLPESKMLDTDSASEYKVEDMCRLSIDLIDPEGGLHVAPFAAARLGREDRDVMAEPEKLVEMAGWVEEACVEGPRMAGFVTKGISQTIAYLRETNEEWWVDNHMWPTEALFFSVELGSSEFWMPTNGHKDPMVGGRIFTELHKALAQLPRSDQNFERLHTTTKQIGFFFVKMQRSYLPHRMAWYGQQQ